MVKTVSVLFPTESSATGQIAGAHHVLSEGKAHELKGCLGGNPKFIQLLCLMEKVFLKMVK